MNIMRHGERNIKTRTPAPTANRHRQSQQPIDHDRSTRTANSRELLRMSLGRDLTPQDLRENRHLIEAMAQHFVPSAASSLTSPPPPPDSDEERRQRPRRAQAGEDSPHFVMPVSRTAGQRAQDRVRGPINDRRRDMMRSARRGRPFLTASSRYLERQRALMDNAVLGTNDSDELLRASRQLEAATSNLRALLDSSTSALSAVPRRTAEEARPAAAASEAHRAKRRRLDTDKVGELASTTRYGRYGQILPGRLRMEIVSCDGGIFQANGGEENYSVENVLKTDGTVYCTKSNRCNLILRHQGGSPFELRELIVKAPNTGYTAPLQAGMVFISMTSDDLLTRTAQYQIQYLPAAATSSTAMSGQVSRSSGGVLAPIMSIRHTHNESPTPAQARAWRLQDIGLTDYPTHRAAQMPADFIDSGQPYTVTTSFSDSENEDLDLRGATYIRPPRNPTEDTESDDDELSLGMDIPSRPPSAPSRTQAPPRQTLDEALEASQVATQEAVKAVGGGLMVPHARFYIEPESSKCTIRFDPPVTGRFILLKMFSPQHNPSGNIDIQSVLAMGYAGPRLFPAISLR